MTHDFQGVFYSAMAFAVFLLSYPQEGVSSNRLFAVPLLPLSLILPPLLTQYSASYSAQYST